MTRKFSVAILFVAAATPLASQEPALSRAMRDELVRSMQKLQLENLEKPYFISYRVQDRTSLHASGAFGSLLAGGEDRRRLLTIEVRVGSPALDNTNFLTFPFGPSGVSRMFFGTVEIPIEEDYQEIRRQLWLATDGVYKKALDDLSKKRATLQNANRSEVLPDFVKAEPATLTDELPAAVVKLDDAESLVRNLSAVFRKTAGVDSATVRLNVTTTLTHYLDSDGNSLTRRAPLVSFTAQAATQAPDGMPLEDFVACYGHSLADLPPAAELSALLGELGARLQKLRAAALPGTYNGPVLFEGQAAAEVFAQMFATRLLGLRVPVAENPQIASFTGQLENPLIDKIGARVLPSFLSVSDNPTLSEFNKAPLVGGYRVDDEGVRAGETRLVESGILKTLLTTRDPVRGVARSSGNRRGDHALPSNLLVGADNGVSGDELRQKLLALVKQRNREYGIVLRRLGNPLLKVSRGMPSFLFGPPGSEGPKAQPAMATYRVYLDGREELIRNAEIADINLMTFKEIVAASRDRIVYSAPFSAPSPSPFSGMMSFDPFGETDHTIVSFVMPSLLFEELTIKKPAGDFPKPPISPNPLAAMPRLE